MIEDGGNTRIKAGAWKSLDRRKPKEPEWGGRSNTISAADSLPDPEEILHLSTPPLLHQYAGESGIKFPSRVL